MAKMEKPNAVLDDEFESWSRLHPVNYDDTRLYSNRSGLNGKDGKKRQKKTKGLEGRPARCMLLSPHTLVSRIYWV